MNKHLLHIVCYIAVVATFVLYSIAGPKPTARDQEVCYQWHVYGVVLNVRTTNTEGVANQLAKLGTPDKAFICPWDSVEGKK